MKKTDKKIDNAIIDALNQVCQIALDEVAGFEWLTHLVNFNDVEKSLRVYCIFDADEALARANASDQDNDLRRLIKQKLAAVNIKIKDLNRQVSFDSQEACDNEQGGKWPQRFKS